MFKVSRKWRKCILYLGVVALMFWAVAGNSACARAEFPKISSFAAAVIDTKSNTMIYSKNGDYLMRPASLTKIVTCLLILENMKMDDVVTVDAAAVGVGGSTMNLTAGEKISVKDLLYGLMLESANDAAVALAIKMSGSEAEFVKRMNARVKAMGATLTSFINANGLTDSGRHITTAIDMARITATALKNPEFRKISQTVSHTVAATNMRGERKLKTSNKLLFDNTTKISVQGETTVPKYPGAIGVKTGTMPAAGHCLVAGALRKDTELVVVVLEAGGNLERYEDAIGLLDYTFKNFYNHQLLSAGSSGGKVWVRYGKETRVDTVVSSGAHISLPKDGMASVADFKITLDKGVKAPIKKGTQVGVVEILEGGEKVAQVPVLISKDVEKGGPWSAIWISDRMAYGMIGGIVLLIAALILWKYLRRRKKQRETLARELIDHRRAEAAARISRKKARRGWPY